MAYIGLYAAYKTSLAGCTTCGMRQSKKSTSRQVMTAIINERKDGGCLEKMFGCTALSYFILQKACHGLDCQRILGLFHRHVLRKLKDLQPQPQVSQFLVPIVCLSCEAMRHHPSIQYHAQQYRMKVQEGFAQVQ